MDKEEALKEIFDNDPLGILNVKPKVSNIISEDSRLISSFQEINTFYEQNNREPDPSKGVQEHQLYSRLKSLRNSLYKKQILINHDIHNLLEHKEKEINSIDDILNDDSLGILDSEADSIFNIQNIPSNYERENADFIAHRKPCKNFEKYESLFKEVQKDLSSGKRKLVNFSEHQLEEGNFFVHNGVLLLLLKIHELEKDKFGKEDGRTYIIFENGTESNMKYRTLGKNLFTNGKTVTANIDETNKEFAEKFGTITQEDKEAGYIYVLKSKSKDERILSIENLFKIGFSTTDIQDRIKNADKEPTYLMAPVEYVAGWQCYNMNTQKFEQLLHNFFSNSCIEIDVFDEKGKRHTPREWFTAPLNIIEEVIRLIINSEIVHYKYDAVKEEIVGR